MKAFRSRYGRLAAALTTALALFLAGSVTAASAAAVEPDAAPTGVVSDPASALEPGETDPAIETSSLEADVGGDYLLVSPTLTITDVSKYEGHLGLTPFVFRVRLSSTATQAVMVDYATSDGSATVADNDYIPVSGTLTIPVGGRYGYITVYVVGDIKNEPTETFLVNLSNPVGATITKASGVGTIKNDDDTEAPKVEVIYPNGGETFAAGQVIVLKWKATDNVGVTSVDLFVSHDGGATYKIIKLGVGNTGAYAWTVAGPATNQALFKVVAHDPAGNTGSDASNQVWKITGPVAVEDELITEFALTRVAPNPTRGPASIEYTVAREANVRLSVLDVQGRTVAVLVDGAVRPGRYQAVWNGAGTRGNSPAGIYFIRYQAGGKNMVKRVTLMP